LGRNRDRGYINLHSCALNLPSVDYSVKFEPDNGEIGAHENLKVAITFIPHKIPEVADIEALLCCDITEMDLPIGCLLKVKVSNRFEVKQIIDLYFYLD
jgi:hypothetical protein